jgi:hypothetical protein
MDCSITKRKGCNYCLRGKTIDAYNFSFSINDEEKALEVSYDRSEIASHDSGYIDINYCPICGKEL